MEKKNEQISTHFSGQKRKAITINTKRIIGPIDGDGVFGVFGELWTMIRVVGSG